MVSVDCAITNLLLVSSYCLHELVLNEDSIIGVVEFDDYLYALNLSIHNVSALSAMSHTTKLEGEFVLGTADNKQQ
jgi:hypothetical protein